MWGRGSWEVRQVVRVVGQQAHQARVDEELRLAGGTFLEDARVGRQPRSWGSGAVAGTDIVRDTSIRSTWPDNLSKLITWFDIATPSACSGVRPGSVERCESLPLYHRLDR